MKCISRCVEVDPEERPSAQELLFLCGLMYLPCMGGQSASSSAGCVESTKDNSVLYMGWWQHIKKLWGSIRTNAGMDWNGMDYWNGKKKKSNSQGQLAIHNLIGAEA